MISNYNERFSKNIWTCVLIFLFICPYPGFLGETILRGIDLSYIFLLVLVYMINNIKGNTKNLINNKFYMPIVGIMFILLFWEVCVLLINALLGEIVVFKDLFELYKVVLYFLAFYVSLNLSAVNLKSDYVWKVLSIIVTIEFILSLLQISFGGYTQYLFSHRDMYRIDYHYSGRAIGTLGNPNFLGVFSAAAMVWYYILLNMKNEHKKIYNIILFFMSLAILLMTQSRTSLLLAVGLILIYTIYILIKKRSILSYMLVLLVSIITFTLIANLKDGDFNISLFGFNFSYLTSGLTTIYNDGLAEQNSFKLRLDLWSLFIEKIKENPWFGYGPSKGVAGIPDVADNNYIFITFKFGFIGLMLWMLLLSSVIYKLVKLYRYGRKNLIVFTILFWICLLVSAFTMESLESIRLATIAFFMTGCCFNLLPKQ